MNEYTDVVQELHGVYLLYSTNAKFKGRTYIGYTVNPNRRIKQHNKGYQNGGARRTSKKGPWIMVMIIHGFPNDISALRFEWAWQHPHKSRRLKQLCFKKSKETSFHYRFRILTEMLQVGPWYRLPLTIRWMNKEFVKQFLKLPPKHMPICIGSIATQKLGKLSEGVLQQHPANDNFCVICFNIIRSRPVTCLNSRCDLVTHLICLSKLFLEDSEYVPIEGECPKCRQTYLWCNLIRKQHVF